MSKRQIEAKTAQKKVIEPKSAKKSRVVVPPPILKISTVKKRECLELEDIRRLIEHVTVQQEVLQASIERVESMLSQDQQDECSIVGQAQKLRLKE